MRTHPLRTSSVLGAVLAAAVVGFAASAPAGAATHLTFGALVPASPTNVIAVAPNTGSCPDPDSDVRITNAYPTQWLKAVASQSSHSSARILLDLDSQGNLLQASIVNTSGNPILDAQALVAARGSKYAPEVHNCSSFKRSYYLDINFDSPAATLPQEAGTPGRRITM